MPDFLPFVRTWIDHNVQIETIKAYRVLLPFVDGPYHMVKSEICWEFWWRA